MKPELKALYDESLLHAIAPRYGVAAEAFESLGGFESFVYRFARGDQPLVLKVTHTVARAYDELMSELDWLGHLAGEGVAVAHAVASVENNLIERLPGGGGEFLVLAYTRAPGEVTALERLDEPLVRAWGGLLGQMHTATRRFRPTHAGFRRLDWHEALVPEFRANPPEDHEWYTAHFDGLVAELEALPRGEAEFGLCHGDLHFGNMFWTGEALTAIDFDDAHHTWFMNDLAIAFYYVGMVSLNRGLDPVAPVEAHFPAFLAGYAEAHELDPAWLAHVPLFLKVRRAVLYAALYTAFPGDTMPPRERGLVDRMRREMEADAPVIDVDFRKFAPYLARAGSPADTTPA